MKKILLILLGLILLALIIYISIIVKEKFEFIDKERTEFKKN